MKTILTISVALAAMVFCFYAGAYYQVWNGNDYFRKQTGIELSAVFAAKERCENIAGPDNCRLIGGFVPKVVINVPKEAQRPQGREL